MDKDYFENVLIDIARRTRKILLRAISDDCTRNYRPNQKTLSKTFLGYCGLAQCIAGYFIEDHIILDGISVKPVATQSLQGWWHGHALLSIKIATTENCCLYLLDPTFKQFMGKNGSHAKNPFELMRQSTEGRLMANELCLYGVTRLTPFRASIYIMSFCQGHRPFDTDNDAFEFFQSPPEHPYHFAYAPGDDRFSRPSLQAAGYTLDC